MVTVLPVPGGPKIKYGIGNAVFDNTCNTAVCCIILSFMCGLNHSILKMEVAVKM